MSMTLEQIKNQLSAIEPNDGTYFGIGPPEIPVLEQLLQDEEVWVASRAIFALSRVPDARALTLLSRSLTDPREEVRVAVAASVSNLKPSDANSILVKLLTDPDLGVRKIAIQAVSAGHDAAVRAKLNDIQRGDPVATIRDIARDRMRSLQLIRP